MNTTNPSAPDDPNRGQSIPAPTSPGTEQTTGPKHDTEMAQVPSLIHLAHWIHADAHGAHLINFPFSFAVFLILTTGLITAGAGIILANPWMAVLGLLTTLIWCFLRGWSVTDE